MADADCGDRRVGSAFAGYRIKALLGRGGMGVVYLGRDDRLERPVALKLIAPELAGQPGFRDRFLTESRLAASLDHSHVIPIYEAGEAAGELYLAMRYVNGTTLRELLHENGPLEPGRALDICEQVAEALDAAHELGLVHRDVKPANVLIAHEGEREHCYLCDFGLAQQTDRPGEHQFAGTLAYTSPEQISGGPIDSRADQYSFACIVCECLTGQPPFPRERTTAALFAHLSDPPPSLHARRNELAEQADTVMARALAKEPADRYPACGDLVADLRGALGLEKPRLSRRALLVATGGAALGLAAAAIVPTILLTRGDDKAPAAASERFLPLASDGVVRLGLSGDVVGVVPVGSAAGPIAYGDGAVWLADKSGRAVYRIDPASDTVVDQIDMPEKADPTALAVGGGTLWLHSIDIAMLLRYDLGASAWSEVDLSGVPSEDLVVADGSLWSVCERILRIDPATGTIETSIDPGLMGKVVAAGDGQIWFAGQEEVTAVRGGSRVWQVDARTSALSSPVELDGTVTGIAVGEGAAWIVTLEDDLVRRIDPVTSAVSEVFRAGRIPVAVTATGGAVWVSGSRDGTVTRFTTATADLKTIELGGRPGDVTSSGGAVWAAVAVV